MAVTILGDEVHDSDKDGKIHAFVKNNLQVWAAQSEYRVPKNATAMEALDAALAANKMTSEKKYGDTYIASVTKSRRRETRRVYKRKQIRLEIQRERNGTRMLVHVIIH